MKLETSDLTTLLSALIQEGVPKFDGKLLIGQAFRALPLDQAKALPKRDKLAISEAFIGRPII